MEAGGERGECRSAVRVLSSLSAVAGYSVKVHLRVRALEKLVAWEGRAGPGPVALMSRKCLDETLCVSEVILNHSCFLDGVCG